MGKIMTIGTDPEFIIKDKYGDVVDARECTPFDTVGSRCKIGCDGAGTPLEIRPRYAPINKVHILIKNIEKLLDKVHEYCYEHGYTLHCGAVVRHESIGGHIHFGHPSLKKFRYLPSKYNNLPLYKRLVYGLDSYFLPIINMLVDHDLIRIRFNEGYGGPNAYRWQKWGIEYRAAYSFLASPFLTRSFFSLASLIAWYIKKIKIDKKQLSRMGYFYDGEDNALLKAYECAKKKVLQLLSWGSPNPSYDSDIVSLFNLIKNKKKADTNLSYCWGFIKVKKPTKRRKSLVGLIVEIEDDLNKVCNYYYSRPTTLTIGSALLRDPNTLYINPSMPMFFCNSHDKFSQALSPSVPYGVIRLGSNLIRRYSEIRSIIRDYMIGFEGMKETDV